jgi:hypothetical protein
MVLERQIKEPLAKWDGQWYIYIYTGPAKKARAPWQRYWSVLSGITEDWYLSYNQTCLFIEVVICKMNTYLKKKLRITS